MTLQEALDIARHAKPRHRAAFEKLQGGGPAAHAIAETASALTKRVDQIQADVEYLQNFKPNMPARARQ
jgi:ABC-type transport system involved in cytochrome bd biosynthesis fused ATPase/permease subunit